MAPNVSPERWMAGGCGLPTALHAVDRAAIKLGDRVLIQGAGPVGLMACALALASGAGWVGVIDTAPSRLEAARNMGADEVIPIDEAEAKVKAATGGRGADIVIEATGNPIAVRQAFELARDNGRVVIVGQYTDAGDVAINPHLHINRKHLEVLGCWGSDLSHVWRAMETLSRLGDRFPWESLISRSYSLAEAQTALEDVAARRVVKALIRP
jgi:L-iditol 2-dehydrogenase